MHRFHFTESKYFSEAAKLGRQIEFCLQSVVTYEHYLKKMPHLRLSSEFSYFQIVHCSCNHETL